MQARLQNSQAGTGQVLVAEAGAQPGSRGSLHTVLGFACQPAALGLAGTSGAGGLLSRVLGSSGCFLLTIFATVCVAKRSGIY